jgi:hypothetical protein
MMPDNALELARRELGLSYLDLWVDCFGLGGKLNAEQLTDYLRGRSEVDRTDHNVIVHALNEAFQDRGSDHPLTYLPAG